jgi:hypothetical protein
LKRFVFLSLSLLLLILIPSCVIIQPPATSTTPQVGTLAVIGTFSSNPATVNSGGTSNLLWNVTGATSVSIDQGIGQVDVAGTKVVSPPTTTVYTISATNSAGTVTRSATIMVNSAPPAGMPPVIGTFSSNLNSDNTSTLSWNVTGADLVSIDQGIGQVDVAGTRVVSPAASTTYTLSATNSTGTVSRSVVITLSSTPPVGTPPVIIFSSNLNSDNTSTLSWNVTGADLVSIDQGIGIVNAAGTKVISPATSAIYTLTATYAKGNTSNDIGTVTRSVTVTASPTSNTPWVH